MNGVTSSSPKGGESEKPKEEKQNGNVHNNVTFDRNSETIGVKKERADNVPGVSKTQQMVLLCCAAFVNMTCTGYLYGLGVVYVDIIQTLQVSSTEASLVQSVTRGVLHGGGIIYGTVLSRFDPANCIIVASLVGTIGFIASSFISNIAVLIVVFGVLTGAGSGIMWISALTVVAPAFRTNSGLAISFVNVGSGLAQIYIPYLFEIFVQEYGWRGAFLLYGGIILNNIAAALLMKVFSPKYQIKRTKIKEVCNPDIFRVLPFAMFLPCVFLIGLSVLVEPWFLVDSAIEKGFTREEGSIFLVIVGVGGLIGRFLILPTHKYIRIGVINHLGIIFALQGAFHVLFGIFRGYWELFGTSVAFGIVNGLYAGFIAMVPSELLGVERFAFGQGIISSLSGISNAIGGPVGGAIKDITGTYDVVYYYAAVCSGIVVLLCVVIALLVKVRPSKVYTLG